MRQRPEIKAFAGLNEERRSGCINGVRTRLVDLITAIGVDLFRLSNAPFKIVHENLLRLFGITGRRWGWRCRDGVSGWRGLRRGAGAAFNHEGIEPALLTVLFIRFLGLRDRQLDARAGASIQHRLVQLDVGEQTMTHAVDIDSVQKAHAVLAGNLFVIAKRQRKGRRHVDLEN